MSEETIHRIVPDLLVRPVKVALVGCGGNGSQMLNGLARLDRAMWSLGHLGGLRVTVWDPDMVSEANIGRQLFAPQDVGLSKAVILVHRVNQFFGLNWEAEARRFERIGHLPDVLISCVDSAKARREIKEILWTQYSQPFYWMDLGNRQNDGQVILGEPMSRADKENRGGKKVRSGGKKGKPVLVPRLPCVTEVFPELLDETIPEDNRPSCSLAEALEHQDLFVNDHVSRWALHLFWTLFRKGQIQHHGYFINLADGKVVPLPVPGGA